MKLLGCILLGCLVVAALQYAIVVLFALALIGALVAKPRETIALLASAAVLNAIAIHPVPTVIGLVVISGAALIYRR